MNHNDRKHKYGAFLAVLLLALQSTANQAALAIDQVGLSEFQLSNGDTFTSGKSFAVRWYKGKSLLLMPLHIFSPDGGFSRYLKPSEINSEVTKLQVYDLSKRSVLAVAGRSLLKSGGTTQYATGSMAGDLLAFELPSSSRLTPFDMLFGLAPAGTKVTILSQANATSSQVTSYRGTISFSGRTSMVIKLNYPLTALSSSGAPIIDAQNKLVGMLVGTQDDARTVVVGLPSSTMISRIYADIGQ